MCDTDEDCLAPGVKRSLPEWILVFTDLIIRRLHVNDGFRALPGLGEIFGRLLGRRFCRMDGSSISEIFDNNGFETGNPERTVLEAS